MYSLGDVVCSAAGRDARRYFVVVEVIDEQYVRIADGALRKLSSPKKKKQKHLVRTGQTLENIAQKLASGPKIFDSEIRNALESLSLCTKQGEE